MNEQSVTDLFPNSPPDASIMTSDQKDDNIDGQSASTPLEESSDMKMETDDAIEGKRINF